MKWIRKSLIRSDKFRWAHSCLNNIVDIVKKLTPSLSDEQCAIIFKICTICALLIRLGFNYAHELREHFVKLLKGLRLQVCSSFAQIFDSYQQRAFAHEELQCFWKFFIEPSILNYNQTLERNSEAGFILPVSFVRLFVSWTRIPLLFRLLNAKFTSEINGETPIELVCNTLIHNGTPKATQNLILEGILNLLTLADEFQPENEVITLEQAYLPEASKEINLGTLILLNHIQKILIYLADHLPKDAKSAKKLPDLYLNILSRLSEFVSDKEVAVNFASTLILYVSKCHFKSEEKLSTILFTISRFVGFVENPEEYLRKIIRLFSSLKGRSPREALIAIVVSISKIDKIAKNAQLHKYLELLVELEAWDSQRINEADSARRHTALSLLLQSLQEDKTIPVTVLQLLAHSSTHTLIEVEDLSLRASASNFFRRLSDYIAGCNSLDENTMRGLLHSHLIELVLKGVQSPNETVRHEMIFSLANLIDLFPKDEILGPFSVLRSPNDKDVDFFENSTHIQLHRRQRAFFRFAEQLATKQVEISSSNLLKFILPILNPYLTEVTSKTSALSDQAIKLFCEILKLTHWPK
uniref:U3 small nucleolar RNA-associated protein 20 N-terminal domain-containing protein n=1 Tax=Acrobeloides nanus TaxID=290746 RepID=A0A914CRX1_9BILA